jgi:hypothetical protein
MQPSHQATLPKSLAGVWLEVWAISGIALGMISGYVP